MSGVRAKKRKLSLVTVFALIEIIIIFLFGLLISVNLFVSTGTAKNRTRQIVEDSYAALTENLANDIKNISRAGFSLMNSDTVIRLKAYYYDKISGDSYARNTAINRTIDDLVSLTTYYDVIDSCALWIAPDGELSYNTLYTFVGDDYRKQLLDKAVEEHRYSPTYEGNLRNNGEMLITLSLSEQDNSVLAIGSGRLYGKGLYNDSTESMKNANYLSNEMVNDFIFAIIGEEMGFVGSCIVLGVFFLIIVECFLAAIFAPDMTGRMLCTGMAVLLTLQVFINVGVATELLPNTGIPLPFISSGLSSLISLFGGMGFVLNVSLQKVRQ